MKRQIANYVFTVCIALCVSNYAEAQYVFGMSGGSKGQTTTEQRNDTTAQKSQTAGGSAASSAMDALFNAMSNGSKGQTTTEQRNDTTAQKTQTASGSAASSAMDALFNAMSNGSKGQTTTEQRNDTTAQKTQTASGSATSSAMDALFNAMSGGKSSGSESSDNNAMSMFGDILSSVIGANTELTVASLEGTWQYAAPACKFKSEDFLKSAGGDIVASQISNELAPIYGKLGFTAQNFSIAFEKEGKFVLSYGKLPLPGTATKAEAKGYFTLDFINLGTVAVVTTPAYFEVVGNKMIILFEADKFVDMFRSIVSKLGITTLDTVFKLVDSYDGVLIGFELNK